MSMNPCCKEEIKKVLENRVLPQLYSLRANIPLTWGKWARKQAKELIDSINKELKKLDKEE